MFEWIGANIGTVVAALAVAAVAAGALGCLIVFFNSRALEKQQATVAV